MTTPDTLWRPRTLVSERCQESAEFESSNADLSFPSREGASCIHPSLPLPSTFLPVQSPRVPASACRQPSPASCTVASTSTSRATRPWHGTDVDIAQPPLPSRSCVAQQQPTPPPVRASPSHRDPSHLRARLPTSSATTDKPRTQSDPHGITKAPCCDRRPFRTRRSARAAVETKQRETSPSSESRWSHSSAPPDLRHRRTLDRSYMFPLSADRAQQLHRWRPSSRTTRPSQTI